ncbi:MAG: deoxycytidine deaminase [Patescibacteria group bacterium]
MILTGSEIKKMVKKNKIILDPFSDKLINPNSYNYRLGDTFLVYQNMVIDTKVLQKTKKIKIPKNGFTLQPGIIYLGSTLEKIGSDEFVPSLIGRSSLGRLGLFLQITADLGHLGTRHNWTLELTCVQPLVVYPGMRIGQVSFWKPDGPNISRDRYRDKKKSYSKYFDPQPNIPDKFFN